VHQRKRFPLIKPKNKKPKYMKNQIKSLIKTYVRDIRETRSNRSVPCIMGSGFTIAIKGRTQSIEKREGGYSFLAMWNRNSIYWTKKTAIAGMKELQPRVPFDLEVIHYNDLRDRHEKVASEMLCSLFKVRNQIA
jgi:hypothetical protein